MKTFSYYQATTVTGEQVGPLFTTHDGLVEWVSNPENFEPNFPPIKRDPTNIDHAGYASGLLGYAPVFTQLSEDVPYYVSNYFPYLYRKQSDNLSLGWQYIHDGDIAIEVFDGSVVFSVPVRIRFRVDYQKVVQHEVKVPNQPYVPEITEPVTEIVYDIPLYLRKTWSETCVTTSPTKERFYNTCRVYIERVDLVVQT